jgi:hypothetical protein
MLSHERTDGVRHRGALAPSTLSISSQCRLLGAVRTIESYSAVQDGHVPDLLAEKSRSTITCLIDLGVQFVDLTFPAHPTVLARPASKAPTACSSSCFFHA